MTGLTTSEVEERRARGEGETGARSVTKSTGAILRENICTLFNALNFAIAILLFAVGAYSNMLFIAIIILNIVIGIVQEFKAKKLVDELTILNQPHAVVLRDGKETTIEAGASSRTMSWCWIPASRSATTPWSSTAVWKSTNRC